MEKLFVSATGANGNALLLTIGNLFAYYVIAYRDTTIARVIYFSKTVCMHHNEEGKMNPVTILAGIVIVILLFSTFRIVQQYERGVVFVLGRLIGVKGPGLFVVPPLITQVKKVDLRIVALQVPPQEVITRDNVTVKVDTVVHFYVVNPADAVVKVVNYTEATKLIGQTTLRNVLGHSELDELLSHLEKINQNLQTIIDEHTERWGVQVISVEIRDIELPATMQRAMAKQAEAEREKRAKVIHAEGELQASTQLAHAAGIMAAQPAALQLRYLQTLTEIAVEKNSTVVFPLPMDLITPLMNSMRQFTAAAQAMPSSMEQPIGSNSHEQVSSL